MLNPDPAKRPPMAPVRWTPLRKHELVTAIRRGDITRHAAMREHGFSEQELDRLIERHNAHGVAGMNVRRLQELRA